MATSDKKQSGYFTPIELQVLLQAYEEYQHLFKKKSNAAAVAKEREAAREKITARVNACNATGGKRNWKQLKMKYKNSIQRADRKKAEARKTGGGPTPPPPPPLTLAEELNSNRPVAEGIPGGSLPVTPQDTSAYIRCTLQLRKRMKPRLLPQSGILRDLEKYVLILFPSYQ